VNDEDAAAEGPSVFTLLPNVPNPFNPSTLLGFRLMNAANIRLAVYDVQGREIAVPAEGAFAAGNHAVCWDGRDRAGRPVSSGVYLYRLTTGGVSEARKMLLVR